MIENNKFINSNGEIVEKIQSGTFNYGKEPDYIKVSLDNIMFLTEISDWIGKVMYKLLKSISYADKGQFIIINAGYEVELSSKGKTIKLKEIEA
ncbi:hypothetical protein [Bacillus tropicus]|nr:hypothetical protein [Bacillus tropicus]